MPNKIPKSLAAYLTRNRLQAGMHPDASATPHPTIRNGYLEVCAAYATLREAHPAAAQHILAAAQALLNDYPTLAAVINRRGTLDDFKQEPTP